jgi:hypothetical protein
VNVAIARAHVKVALRLARLLTDDGDSGEQSIEQALDAALGGAG